MIKILELCLYLVLLCCGYMAELYFETNLDTKIWNACGQILPAAKFIVSQVMGLASQQVMIIAILEEIVHRSFGKARVLLLQGLI